MNILPEDIAERLYRRKSCWYYGVPEIRLLGSPRQFGELIFDFGDEVLSWNIRIPIAGRHKLLDVAYLAVYNFDRLVLESA
jgi:hypothetical protein